MCAERNNGVAVFAGTEVGNCPGSLTTEPDDSSMSFATEQIARIETLLAENAGVQSVVVGNTTVTFDDLLKQYDYWKNVADREAGRRPGAKQINLSGF